jgi:predicted RNase H-like nuclease (RuvC/YqgF family)
MTDNVAKNATPRTELEKQIMDPNIPKYEREWWAAGEIERLEARIEEWKQRYETARLAHEEGRAEIERLRTDKDQLIAIAADEMRMRDAEIQRLRAALGEKP